MVGGGRVYRQLKCAGLSLWQSQLRLQEAYAAVLHAHVAAKTEPSNTLFFALAWKVSSSIGQNRWVLFLLAPARLVNGTAPLLLALVLLTALMTWSPLHFLLVLLQVADMCLYSPKKRQVGALWAVRGLRAVGVLPNFPSTAQTSAAIATLRAAASWLVIVLPAECILLGGAFCARWQQQPA
jgi:hypothetical protein